MKTPWDHHINPEGFIHHQSMGSNFLNRYVNTVSGSDFIYTKIEYTGSDWETYIYDLIDTEYDLMIDEVVEQETGNMDGLFGKHMILMKVVEIVMIQLY